MPDKAKKARRTLTALEEFGAVPKGFPADHACRFMRRVGNAAFEPERLKELLIEGAQIFGPAFIFYYQLAHLFSMGQDEASRRYLSNGLSLHHHQLVQEVLGMDIVQDPAKLAAHLAPPVFPKVRRYIYLVRTIEGYYKIGITQDLEARMAALKTSTPHGIELIHSIIHEDATDIEKQLHRHFAEKRTRGEWFRLTDEDVEYIRLVEPSAPPQK